MRMRKPIERLYFYLRGWLRVVPFIVMLGSLVISAPVQDPKGQPETRIDNVSEIIHGVEIVDPYRWLEDQERAETRK